MINALLALGRLSPMNRVGDGLLARQIDSNDPATNLPGAISGFGGATFDTAGRQVTPVTPPPHGGNALAPPPGVNALAALASRNNHLPPDARRKPEQRGPLGGSMRQPFDYEAAVQELAGEQPKVKDWQWVLAGLGAIGGNSEALDYLTGIRDKARERRAKAQETVLSWRHDAWQDQNQADLRAAAPFTIGRDRVMYDPATGRATTIYNGPEDFEEYAQQLGLQPGTPEYFEAVEDYVLRANGPSAYERDLGLEDRRTANDERLEGVRQTNRQRMEDQRQRNRVGMEGQRQANRIQVRKTPPARAAGGSGRQARPTATDSRGNKVEWNGKAWVPVK